MGGYSACGWSQGIWDWLCAVAHCGRDLVAIFRDFFASISGILILAGGMGTRLSFYGV